MIVPLQQSHAVITEFYSVSDLEWVLLIQHVRLWTFLAGRLRNQRISRLAFSSRGFRSQNPVFGEREKKFSIEFVIMAIIVGGKKILLESVVIKGNWLLLVS